MPAPSTESATAARSASCSPAPGRRTCRDLGGEGPRIEGQARRLGQSFEGEQAETDCGPLVLRLAAEKKIASNPAAEVTIATQKKPRLRDRGFDATKQGTTCRRRSPPSAA
jgi:hypothetical protein